MENYLARVTFNDPTLKILLFRLYETELTADYIFSLVRALKLNPYVQDLYFRDEVTKTPHGGIEPIGDVNQFDHQCFQSYAHYRTTIKEYCTKYKSRHKIYDIGPAAIHAIIHTMAIRPTRACIYPKTLEDLYYDLSSHYKRASEVVIKHKAKHPKSSTEALVKRTAVKFGMPKTELYEYLTTKGALSDKKTTEQK